PRARRGPAPAAGARGDRAPRDPVRGPRRGRRGRTGRRAAQAGGEEAWGGSVAGGASASGPVEQLDQFSRLAALIGGVAAGDGPFDAVVQMVLENLALDPGEGGADGPGLGQDVNAVAVLRDHARDAAHLTLDAVQAVQQGRLVRMRHRSLLRAGEVI